MGSDGDAEAREHLIEGLLAVEAAFGFDQAAMLTIQRRSEGTPVTALDELAQAPSIDPLTISMLVRPPTEDNFVQFVVRVNTDAASRVECVEIDEQRGLDCASESEIRDRLTECLEIADGDLMTIMFLALELAEEYNAPHGSCAFCLETLGTSDGQENVLRMGCFHCFHAGCFWEWFDWKQRQVAQRVAELTADHNNNKALVAKAMADAEIEVSDVCNEEYVLQCPNCRVRLWPLPAREGCCGGSRDSGGLVGAVAGAAPSTVSLCDLTEDVRRKVRELQVRQGAGLERQRRAGGVVHRVAGDSPATHAA